MHIDRHVRVGGSKYLNLRMQQTVFLSKITRESTRISCSHAGFNNQNSTWLFLYCNNMLHEVTICK